MKILIAPDKFKGSLTALQATRAIRRGLEAALPEVVCRELPMADGGEGSAEALCAAAGGEWVTATAHDALARPVQAGYAFLPDGTAAINMSEASGLWRLTSAERDPSRASTFGTGELMANARRRGARRLLVGLGGSATNDGGFGMAAALGWRFLDRHGAAVKSLPLHLPAVARIQPPEDRTFPETVVMCDVVNPLLGPRGASAVFGPQKGADARTLPLLEAGLRHFADVIAFELGYDLRDVPGAGAGGGLGFGLLSFCGATLRSGFETVAEAVGLHDAILESDLVITGEGCLDGQTLEGKGPAGIAFLARRLGKPVVAFGGMVLERAALGQIFDAVFALKDDTITVETSILEAEGLLEKMATALAVEFILLRGGRSPAALLPFTRTTLNPKQTYA